jgi:hypothetical protein
MSGEEVAVAGGAREEVVVGQGGGSTRGGGTKTAPVMEEGREEAAVPEGAGVKEWRKKSEVEAAGSRGVTSSRQRGGLQPGTRVRRSQEQ